MARPIITFTSDFGHRDWFVGVVHGVIHHACTDAKLVDLTHEIPPGNVRRAAFVLEAAAQDFPQGTVHLAVVDPGVGTTRRALAVRAHGQVFVGPDNGVLEHAFCDDAFEAHELTEEKFFRKPVSRTFHGRDIFAPVAAHIACGTALKKLGPRVRDPLRLRREQPEPTNGELTGCIMFIDRFGNALTNLREYAVHEHFPGTRERDLVIKVGSREIKGIARSYGDHAVGELIAVMGSSGRLEIAMVGGDVSVRYGMGEGDPVRVSTA